jgi:hypothetical protein
VVSRIEEQLQFEINYRTIMNNSTCTCTSNVYVYMYVYLYVPMYSLDATEPKPEYGHGRYLNHSRLSSNLTVRRVTIKNNVTHVPMHHLCLFSTCTIEPNTELLFDYGDRQQTDLAWLQE